MNPNLSDYLRPLCPIHINDLCRLFGKKQTQIIELLTPILKTGKFTLQDGVVYVQDNNKPDNRLYGNGKCL